MPPSLLNQGVLGTQHLKFSPFVGRIQHQFDWLKSVCWFIRVRPRYFLYSTDFDSGCSLFGYPGNLEERHLLDEFLRQFKRLPTRSACLFDQGGVLLRDLIKSRDGIVDLFDTGGLLHRGSGDLTHDIAHSSGAGLYGFQ